MKLYLAHPMNKRFFVRDEIQPKLEAAGIEVVNPFIGNNREKLFFDKRYKHSDSIQKAEIDSTTPEEIVEMEKAAITECDGVFAYVPHEAYGTAMEILFNSSILNRGKKRTFVYVNPSNDNKKYLVDHPWLLAHATVGTDIDKLIKLIK